MLVDQINASGGIAGVPLRIGDVADVTIGHEIRRGAVTALVRFATGNRLSRGFFRSFFQKR